MKTACAILAFCALVLCSRAETPSEGINGHPHPLAPLDEEIMASGQVLSIEGETEGAEVTDSLAGFTIDSLSMLKPQKVKLGKQRNKSLFVPNPKRALWLSLVLPGAGQIYNRKYWKLPIIYGGFIGCTYALLWNQQMYDDYSQAYIDIMDDDPATASYNNMLPMGYDISGREEQFKKIFRHKRDYYRKYRDMSIFAFFGVYLISVVDAYVDAQLSTFDISKDLSLSVEPASIEINNNIGSRKSRAIGVQCSLNF